MAKAKTNAQLDREIEAELNKRARYMLVDAVTGKDMREANEIEIVAIQKNRSPKHPEGRAVIELGGGPGSGTRPKGYEVTLRMIGVHQPTRAQLANPKLPKETYAARDRHGNIVATSETVAGAMRHADTMLRTGELTVRGEYTSDGHHWGIGHGRTLARRASGGRWLVG